MKSVSKHHYKLQIFVLLKIKHTGQYMSNFPPLEVVDRRSETQSQVVENLNKLT